MPRSSTTLKSTTLKVLPPSPDSRISRLNPDLMEGGEPNPHSFWGNIRTYGHPCPRREYVESTEPPTTRDLAKKWSVSQALINKWKHEQKWEAERGRYWSEIEEQRQHLTKEAIVDFQGRVLASQINFWGDLLQALDATVKKGYIEEQSATGAVRKREYTPKDVGEVARAADVIIGNLNRAVGLNTAIIRQSNAHDQDGPEKVRRVVYNMKAEGPEALPEGQVVEGETEDG